MDSTARRHLTTGRNGFHYPSGSSHWTDSLAEERLFATTTVIKALQHLIWNCEKRSPFVERHWRSGFRDIIHNSLADYCLYDHLVIMSYTYIHTYIGDLNELLRKVEEKTETFIAESLVKIFFCLNRKIMPTLQVGIRILCRSIIC